jgi:hypothetical protein
MVRDAHEGQKLLMESRRRYLKGREIANILAEVYEKL